MESRRTGPRKPRNASAPRDYRTLTLPATPRPPRDVVRPRSNAGQRFEGPADWDAEWEDERAAEWQDAYDPVPRSRALRAMHAPAQSSAKAGATNKPAIIQPRQRGATLAPAPYISLSEARRPPWKKRLPIWIGGNLVAIIIVVLAFMAPNMTGTATASACDWYTVKPGNTLRDIANAHRTTASTVAQANHITTSTPLYVGQKLCMPTTWWAQANTTPLVPDYANLALPPGIMAGEPCTADRSMVWTGVISRWAIPPGCFGLIYSPNPRDYMVNGQVIGGFGWCNWWPEALLRDPHALDRPAHAQVRVGVPVFYAPQAGQHLGHYAFVESIGTGQYAGWILISEMNMYWRGGGWAKVDYRYIAVDYPGAQYLYN